MPDNRDDVEVVALVKEVNATMESMKADSSKAMAALQESVKASGSEAKAALAKADEIAAKIGAQAETILALEQKLAENVNKGQAKIDTLGEMVIKSEQFKKFASGDSNKFRIEANTIIGQEGSPPSNSQTLVAPDRLPGIIGGAFRLLKIQDVLPVGQTAGNMIQFTRESLWTNNAAETAEAAQKPESALEFELVNAPVVTIAHFIKASKQILDDAPALRSYIDTRMRYGVEYRVDNQLLNGNGVGQNISGMTKSGNYTAFTPVSGENQLDSINRGIFSAIGADYPATVIIMNPADWGAISRLKVGTSDATYIIGQPTGIMGPNLWGLPVVVTNAMTQGKFLVANMEVAYQLWNRQSTVVEIFEQNEDDVEKNLLTIRAERRLALATYLPAASRYGNLVA